MKGLVASALAIGLIAGCPSSKDDGGTSPQPEKSEQEDERKPTASGEQRSPRPKDDRPLPSPIPSGADPALLIIATGVAIATAYREARIAGRTRSADSLTCPLRHPIDDGEVGFSPALLDSMRASGVVHRAAGLQVLKDGASSARFLFEVKDGRLCLLAYHGAGEKTGPSVTKKPPSAPVASPATPVATPPPSAPKARQPAVGPLNGKEPVLPAAGSCPLMRADGMAVACLSDFEDQHGRRVSVRIHELGADEALKSFGVGQEAPEEGEEAPVYEVDAEGLVAANAYLTRNRFGPATLTPAGRPRSAYPGGVLGFEGGFAVAPPLDPVQGGKWRVVGVASSPAHRLGVIRSTMPPGVDETEWESSVRLLALSTPRPKPTPLALKPYPASRWDAFGALPAHPLAEWLATAGAAAGTTSFGALWGRAPNDLPFLVGKLPREVEDTRRWRLSYELQTGKKHKRKKLFVRFAFIDGGLYEVRFRFRKQAKKLGRVFQAALGREPDSTAVDPNGVRERTWLEGALAVTLRDKRGAFALSISDRARLEHATRRLADGKPAERTVADSVRSYYSRKHRALSLLHDNRRVTERHPEYGDAWVNQCHALYDLGRFEEAEARCSRALVVTGENSVRGEAKYFLGLLVATRTGNLSHAAQLLAEALALIPSGWAIRRHARHRLSSLRGKHTKKGLSHAIEQTACYQQRDGRRGYQIPTEFGFGGLRFLESAAARLGVDVAGLQAKGADRCRKR